MWIRSWFGGLKEKSWYKYQMSSFCYLEGDYAVPPEIWEAKQDESLEKDLLHKEGRCDALKVIAGGRACAGWQLKVTWRSQLGVTLQSCLWLLMPSFPDGREQGEDGVARIICKCTPVSDCHVPSPAKNCQSLESIVNFHLCWQGSGSHVIN